MRSLSILKELQEGYPSRESAGQYLAFVIVVSTIESRSLPGSKKIFRDAALGCGDFMHFDFERKLPPTAGGNMGQEYARIGRNRIVQVPLPATATRTKIT